MGFVLLAMVHRPFLIHEATPILEFWVFPMLKIGFPLTT